MKLSNALAQKVEEQHGVEAFPEEHPVTAKLVEAFGDHTFFLDADGLNVVEPNPEEQDGTKGVVIKLAAWNDDRTQLQPHEPVVLPVTVDLSGADAPDEPEDPKASA